MSIHPWGDEPDSISPEEEAFNETYPTERMLEEGELTTWIAEYSDDITEWILLGLEKKVPYQAKDLLDFIAFCWAREHQDDIDEAWKRSQESDGDY